MNHRQFVARQLAGAALAALLGCRQHESVPARAAATTAQADSFERHVQAGNQAMDAGRYVEARTEFDRALRLHFDPDVATDRGICLRREGRDVEALADFEYVTMARPDHWQARYNKAVLLLENGRVSEAQRDLDTLKKHNAAEPAVQALERAIASKKSGPSR